MSDALKIVESIETDRPNQNLYESIVTGWEAIVDENTDELDLVSADQADSWLRFKKTFTERIIAVGERAIDKGWDRRELDAIANVMKRARHEPKESLLRKSEPVKTAKLIDRLKGILSK
jgi:hypothetical protein